MFFAPHFECVVNFRVEDVLHSLGEYLFDLIPKPP